MDGGGAELLELEPPNGALPVDELPKGEPEDGALGLKLPPPNGDGEAEVEVLPPIRVM